MSPGPSDSSPSNLTIYNNELYFTAIGNLYKIPNSVVTPPTSPTTGLTLATPMYDCTTGQLSLSTTGGNGTTVEYRIAGVRDWATSNSFTIPAYQRTSTSFTLEARQNGVVVSLPFNPGASCGSTPTPPVPPTPPTGAGLTLAQPTYDCTTGQLLINPAGGNGQPTEYRVVGLRDWTASNSFTVPSYQRNGTRFTLEARQSGVVVSLPFTAVCPPTTPLTPANPAALTITSFNCFSTNGALSSVNFVVGYANGSFTPALPDLFINGVTATGKLGQPYTLEFDANQYMDAIQDQATRSTYFVWNFRQACTTVTNTTLTLTSPTFDCASGQLLINTAGGSGQPIEYRVLGLRNWSPDNTFTVPVYQRNGTTFTLEVRQGGREVNAPYTATCPVNTRIASTETTAPFGVVVYPNPVGEQFRVGVSGAAGQRVRYRLTTLSGQPVVDQQATAQSDAHTETIKLPASATGLYLLQVSTDSQSRSLKVLRP